MKTLVLKIRDIKILSEIQQALSKQQVLTKDQQTILIDFLGNLPLPDLLLSEKIPLFEPIEVKLLDLDNVLYQLDRWKDLFHNLPGYDYCPFCYFIDKDNIRLLKEGIVIVAVFAPTLAYNAEKEKGFEVRLKDDGTAIFRLPTLEDAEQYPELYNFKGIWKDAYLLLIATLQKGWPMEEFPEELQKFLPKQ